MQIAEIDKNAHEKIIVSVEEYRGHSLCNCRVYFEGRDGQWLPTKKGISLSLNTIEAVVNALQEARNKLEIESYK